MISAANLTNLYQNEEYRIIAFFVNNTISTIIPFFIICVFGSVIIKNFKTLKRARETFRMSRIIAQNHEDQISLATNLVLTHCILFGLTEVSSITVYCFAVVDPTFVIEWEMNTIAHILSDVNNFLIIFRASVSFLLYWMSCSQYRQCVKRLIMTFFMLFRSTAILEETV